jgi:AcrR family transcriptional regulator
MRAFQLPEILPTVGDEVEAADERGFRADRRVSRATAMATCALELFLEEGLVAVTIDQIVTRAKRGKGSFYRYFQSKDALVERLVEPLRKHVEEAGTACSDALKAARNKDELYLAYQSLALQLAGVFTTWKPVVLLYLQENRGAPHPSRVALLALARRVEEIAIELTHAAMQHGLIRPLDPNVSAVVVIGAVEQLMYRSFDDPRFERVDVVAAALTQLVLEGVRVRDVAD